MSMRRGALIVFEGIDRTGKSTLSKAIVERLNASERPTRHIRFPDRSTEVGKVIDLYLTKKLALADEGLHLLMSANRWEKKEEIEAALKAGECVVCDRYCYSGVAYSWAKDKEGMTEMWCKAPDSGLPQPDLVLFLDLHPDAAAARASYGDEIYEESEFQKSVRRKYELLRDADAADESERTWTVIDADKTLQQLEEELLGVVEKCISSVQVGTPLGRMWLSAMQAKENAA